MEVQPLDENQQVLLRQEKLANLRQNGLAFPNDFKRTALAQEIHAEFNHYSKAELEALAVPAVYQVAGRLMLKRVMGKASFITIQDVSGRIQIYLRQNDLGPDLYEQFQQFDLGDIVGVSGAVFKTNTGELSLHASEIRLLTKSLRPLPDKFHGLTDHELRHRQRYLDLMVNEDSRHLFRLRSHIIQWIRQYLLSHQYLEVETPMMQVIPGGATARPFKTHHHALDMDLYLRVSPELYLKRLVVGGFERVFEINRNFRNEGLSTRHNPEFTMLEFYQAYATYHDLIQHTETMLRGMVQDLLGQPYLMYQGQQYDLSQPFAKMTVLESILHFNPNLVLGDLMDLSRARAVAEALDIKIDSSAGLGKVQIEIFEKTVESKLLAPTFITEYPTEVSPLARANDQNPFVTDRFEFFMGGREIANGFSELNDAEDQASRFKAQVAAKEAGDDEAMHYDADYVQALEYGLPPTAGEGIGIDRLVMLLADQASIRDVILFPHLRPVDVL